MAGAGMLDVLGPFRMPDVIVRRTRCQTWKPQFDWVLGCLSLTGS